MQIRDALNKEPLYERRLYYPVLDTFMRALPYHYQKYKMEKGYTLCVEIVGSSGGTWFIEGNDSIELVDSPKKDANTTVKIMQENAWKIFTRWTDKNVYKVSVVGNETLGEHIKLMNCLMIKN